MAQFVISYFGGEHPTSEEAKQKHFADYQNWLSELGSAIVTPMVPFKQTRVIAPNGEVTEGSAVALMGHTIIEADNLELAVTLAQSCPFLAINGTLEVAEIAQM